MLRPRDLLYRFRRSGAPGAAGATGVPVAGGTDPAAELAVLFAALEDTERQCRALREDADTRAGRILAGAEARAHELVDRARESQDAERAEALARLRRRGEDDAAALALDAQARAHAILDRADRNRDQDVGLVVDRVRRLLDQAPEAGTS